MMRIRFVLTLCGLSLMLAGAGCHSLNHNKDCCETKGYQPPRGILAGHLGNKGECVAACDTACGPNCQPACQEKRACLFGGHDTCCEKGCDAQCDKSRGFSLFGSKNRCDSCQSSCDACDGGKGGHTCCLFGGKDKCRTADVCDSCDACNGECGGKCNGKCNGPCGKCGCQKYEHQLVSGLGLGIAQTLHVGEIQVDECKLERILESRKRMRAEEQRVYSEYVHAQEQYYREVRERQLRQYVDSLGVGGDCCGPKPPCPPMTICELPPPPPTMPLRPTEIPMLIPVTLEVGVENTCIEEPCVRRIALPTRPPVFHKRPCPPSCPPTKDPFAPAAVPPAPLTKAQPKSPAKGPLPTITPASATKAPWERDERAAK